MIAASYARLNTKAVDRALQTQADKTSGGLVNFLVASI